MRMNEPMFTTEQHELYLGEVFVEYIGPELFTCYDQDKTIYLGVSSGLFEDKPVERWVLVPISEPRLVLMLKDELTLCEMFKEPEDGLAMIIELDIETLVETERTVPASELDDDWLPTPGFYLELEGD